MSSIFATNDGPAIVMELREQMKQETLRQAAIPDSELLLMTDLDEIKAALRARQRLAQQTQRSQRATTAIVAHQAGIASHWKQSPANQ
jgi:hypothetical protein